MVYIYICVDIHSPPKVYSNCDAFSFVRFIFYMVCITTPGFTGPKPPASKAKVLRTTMGERRPFSGQRGPLVSRSETWTVWGTVDIRWCAEALGGDWMTAIAWMIFDVVFWQLTYHVQYTWQRHIIIRNSNIVTFSSGNWGNVCLCTSLSKNKRCRCTQTTNPCTEKQSWNPVLFVFDPRGHVHFSYQNLSHSFSYFSWWGMGVTTGRDVLATTPVGVILSPRRHEFDLTIEVWRDPVEFFRIKMILWGFHWIWMTMLMLMLLFWIHFMKRYTYSCQNSKFHQTKWNIMLLFKRKPI